MKSICGGLAAIVFVLFGLLGFFVAKLGDTYAMIDLLHEQLQEEKAWRRTFQEPEIQSGDSRLYMTKGKVRPAPKKIPQEEQNKESDHGCNSQYLQPDITPYLLQYTFIASI
jgi:hypothetical protein